MAVPQYTIWNIDVAMTADAGGDASGQVRVRLRWDSVANDGRENELLMELWRLWYARMLEQARKDGVGESVLW